MPVLPVVRMEQVNSRFCGPAVAGMILRFFGQSPALQNAGWQQLWQHALWGYIKAATTGPGPPGPLCIGRDLAFGNQQGGTCIGGFCACWDTTPQALEAVLNDELAGTQRMIVVRKPPAEFVDATAAIIDSIDAQVPAAALGNGGQHWLVVRGYRSGRRLPTPVVIDGRRINGLYVRDSQRAYRNFISMTWWQDWFDETDCGVVDPVAGYSDHRMLITIVEDNVGRRMMSKRPGGDGQSGPIPPGAAIPITQAVRMADDLAASLVSEEEPDEGWAEAFAGARASEAFLVKRLDRENSYFWVVLFTRNGRETARMALAARTGELLEVESIAAGEDQIEKWVSAPSLPDGTPAPLVWKPSNESPTPLLPFYELPSTGAAPRYMRADGEMFDALTRSQGR